MAVSPYIGEIDGVSDVVLSLAGVAPADAIRFQSPSPPSDFTRGEMTWGQTTVQALAEAGINSAVTIADKFEGKATCYNIAVTGSATLANGLKGQIITSATYSVGFNIGVVAFSMKNEAKVTVPALMAASSTLDLASSAYQATLLGAGVGALPIVKPILLASTSEFNVQTYEALGVAEDELQDYLSANKDSLTPSLTSVFVDTAILLKTLFPIGQGKYLDDTLSQTYAFERCWHGATLEEATSDPRVKSNNLDVALIEDVYQTILHLAKDEKPTAVAKAVAKDVLDIGRY